MRFHFSMAKYNQENIDQEVINDFGNEWDRYNQNDNNVDLDEAFKQYFHIFPSEFFNTKKIGFDAGCGSGRWAKYIAPKVKKLYCIEPSEKAIKVAKNNLKFLDNCVFECCSINSSKIENETMDFGYCLGVLHHIPDTKNALLSCTEKLKKGSPFLLYMYYNFDNKPYWFKLIWLFTDLFRKFMCRLPFNLKLYLSKVIAIFIYFPLAKLSQLIESLGINVTNIPLSDYRRKSFYFMSTDALDRFGTKLEKRFSKVEIISLMKKCGLHSIEFSKSTPFYVAIGYKK